MARPHILWIMTDQHRRDCLGAYGARTVRTPHLDRLAGTAVAFDRFYSTCPLCVPARSSLHTGRYAHSCGGIVNGFTRLGDEASATLNPDEVTVDELLANAGYHLGHVGVSHVKTRPPLRERVPFAAFVSDAEYAAYLKRKGLQPPDETAHQQECPTRFGDEVRPVRFSAPNPGRHPFEPADFLDCFYAREAARFVAEAPPDRPFALFCFLWLPHPPFVIPEPYFSMYSPEDVVLPPNVMAPQTGKPPMHLEHLPGQVGATPDRAGWRKAWAGYLGAVALADACIGTVLDALEARGATDETLIVFHPDHGEMLGAHRYFQKMVCYEEAIHLPLIIRPPGDGAGGRCARLCSHIDIAPTMLDYAGVPVPARMQGESLREEIDVAREPAFPAASEAGAPAAPRRTAVFSEYNGNVVRDLYQRSIVTERYQYIWNMDGVTELYDLADDPYQLRNLSGRRDVADVEADLREQLVVWMRETGDFLNGDIEAADRH
jgi:arylsulfatase A-like enzyme